jgi:mRNA interferase MazF
VEPFELFIANISWGGGGKNRPVLVLLLSEDTISVYPVTTQYENKSESIKSRYFKINDWSQAGLDRQSYIDTGILLDLPLSVIKGKKPIGKLTIVDKKRLLAFFTKSKTNDT